MPVPSVAAAFATVSARQPDALAVVGRTRRLTYGELDAASRALSLPGTGPVALVLAHGAPLAIGLLAAFRAGRVAVPIDPSMPAPRRERILDDAGADAVVTADGAVRRDVEPATIAHPRVVAPDAVAMLLYTSGSTGAPTGVVYSHDRLLERVVRRDRFGLGPGDRLGVFGSAGMNLFRALLTGATLVTWDMATDGLAGIPAWIARERLTLLHGTPTLFRRLTAPTPSPQAFPSLRWVSVTGEPMLRADAEALRRTFPPPCAIVNGLGTTEAGTFCQWTVDADRVAGETMPVGTGVEGMTADLVDDEIVVRGDLLAAGYWRRPDLEARRFRDDGRSYLTGDVGRREADGALVHLGRRDQQLKIRGVRIEAAEVEGALLAHPAVREAAVFGDGGRLVACIAAADGSPQLGGELARVVRGRLPDAMVPEGWSFVASLPIGATGKVDRRALPVPPPRPAPPDAGIVERVLARAARDGTAVAYRAGDVVLTFAGLAARSAALAARLRDAGVGRESLVAVAVAREPAYAVCVLAVLRAGGACLPLDPKGPAARNALMLRDSGARWLLGRPNVLGDVPDDVLRIHPDEVGSPPPPADPYDPDRVAFVLYTSGSTGRPKGVELRERQVLHRLAWDWGARPATAGEVACQRGATGFVDALAEWLGPLLAGVPVEILGDELLSRPHDLVAHLARRGVTRILLVPSQLALLLDLVDDLGARLPALRRWTVSGEALSMATLERFRRALPAAELWNVYGATEAWDATCHRVGPGDTTVSIGTPLPGMRAYVLDDAMAPVATGVAGDLWLAGDGLARGYRDDAALTRARFVPNPFAPGTDDRLYRTGDRARRRDDGTLELLGRADRQVKVHGVRVELGEVEAVLTAQPGVREAAVVADAGRIVAYVVGAGVDVAALRGALRDRLPPAAVPRDVVVRAALPRTDRGKLDRAALATGLADGPPIEPAPGPGTPTELELTIMQVFGDLLRRGVGVDDDFFDAGGDSLLAIRLVAELEALTGCTLPLDAVAVSPTARGVAGAITRGGFAWTATGCLTQHAGGAAPPLFGICGAWGYAVRLLRLGRALGEDVPFHALQPPGMDWPADVDLRDIGAHYADVIARLQPGGPIQIIGTSVGGVIAFEVALQLEARGRSPALLAMVDSALPEAALKPLPDVDEGALGDLERAGRRVYAAHRRAVAAYRPAAMLAAPLVYFLCTDGVHRSHVGWQRLARRPIDVVPVPGGHGAFHVEPQLGAIARGLRDRLLPASPLRRPLGRVAGRQ